MLAQKLPEAHEQPASAFADPQNQTRFTVVHSDRLFVLETYRADLCEGSPQTQSKKENPVSFPLVRLAKAPPPFKRRAPPRPSIPA
jgi:hypothetical protein